MDAPAGDPREESIGDLFGRLVEDGRAYAEAELGLYQGDRRCTAPARARGAGLVALAPARSCWSPR